MYIYIYIYTHDHNHNLPVVPDKAVERLVVVSHGWQSEPTDGPKGGWSCVFWSGCNGCSGHLTAPGCCVV